jgi:hypothetical protein
MTKTNAAAWKFQTADGLSVHNGSPTDSRGLKLRAESGYTHVNMGDGWLQLSVAIRKLKLAEAFAGAEAR